MAESTDGSPGSAQIPDRPRSDWLALATRGFVGLGIALRVAAYLLDFPLWWDEAFVGVNLLRRDYLDLLRPLDYGQVCPLLFLWAERTSVGLLGFSEWSLRAFPLACALASVPLFRLMAGRVVGGRPLLLAVAIFAVSVHPIRHAADVKPYSADLLAALLLQWAALGWVRDPARPRPLLILAALAPVALLASHPAIFVAAGLGLALIVPAWKTRRPGVVASFVAYGLIVAMSAALIYVGFTRDQASAASPGMKAMWARSFPPLDSPIAMARWLVVAHTGDMLAYPCGGERGASTASLLLLVAGVAALIRRGRPGVVGVLLCPLIPALAASALGRYPYGGPAPHGSSARILQYLAPGFCLLIGVGADAILGRISSPAWRDRWLRVGLVGLAIVGLVPIVAGVPHPYRAYQAKAARDFARRFWPEVEAGAEVASLRWDLGVAEWDSIRLGIAVALCDEAIESPSRRRGGPDWGRVSATRPLRCVLEVAPEADSPAVVRWLTSMDGRYRLLGRRTHLNNLAEPGRKPDVERFEVFEFIPRDAPAQPSIGR